MKKKMHPYLFILLTFVAVILVGTIALMMPFASTTGKSIGFIDALFMATSAVCVTGLSVMKNGLLNDFTVYGNTVMVILMEIGGLSFITIAFFFFTILGGKIGISDSFLLRESLNQNTLRGLLNLVRKIIIVSFTVQLICAIINFFPLYEYVNITYGSDNAVLKAIGMSLFHSAASFNNAGFDVFGSSSMEQFASTAGIISTMNVAIINSTTIVMIILGGIGFPVILDVLKIRRWKILKLHTKITLLVTLVLVLGGTLLIKVSSDMPWLEALFTSVTTRTAGFATYNMGRLDKYPAAYLVVIVLMIIGASPCSTGGGIKTTTFAVIILAICSFAKGKKTKAFNRSIGDSQIFKAFALIVVALFIVLVGTTVIAISQPELGFEKILFEVSSAFSTTGLSMGITPELNSFSRLFMCILMFLGRIGPLTVIGIVNKNWMVESKEKIKYVEESVIIG